MKAMAVVLIVLMTGCATTQPQRVQSESPPPPHWGCSAGAAGVGLGSVIAGAIVDVFSPVPVGSLLIMPNLCPKEPAEEPARPPRVIVECPGTSRWNGTACTSE